MHMYMYMISDTYQIQSSLMLHTQALSAGKQFTATVSFPLNPLHAIDAYMRR